MKIIAFTGPAGAGKTTAAQYLQRAHDFKLLSFAAPIKHMLGILAPDWRQYNKEHPHPGLSGRSFRHAAQTLGTEWGRGLISPTIWTDHLLRTINRSSQDRFVIDDLRFANEADLILGLEGKVCSIEGRRSVLEKGTADHASEGQIFKITGKIFNEGTIEDLEQAIEKLL